MSFNAFPAIHQRATMAYALKQEPCVVLELSWNDYHGKMATIINYEGRIVVVKASEINAKEYLDALQATTQESNPPKGY